MQLMAFFHILRNFSIIQALEVNPDINAIAHVIPGAEVPSQYTSTTVYKLISV